MNKDEKPRRLRDWPLDIRDALNNIKSDIGALDEDAFAADGKTLRAVTKSIEKHRAHR